ncbi:MAG: radical SAM protein [Campylobacterales bacterium]|nr:radical SAM protein [Campylobacterales bacterium]
MSGIVFGPVTSRRFGISLGVDLSPKGKQCNFDCLYCELAKAPPVQTMHEVVPYEDVLEAVKQGLNAHPQAQYITLTANGEPTLYPYLKELVHALKALHVRQKLLLLSNGSTIANKEVQAALQEIDVVKLSLDCASQRCFEKLDRPHKTLRVDEMIKGMQTFAKTFRHTLILEILVVEGVNDTPEAFEALAQAIGVIAPARVDVGTIARPPAYGVKGVSEARLRELARLIVGVPVTVPRDANYASLFHFNEGELLELLTKRPQSTHDVENSFDETSKKALEALMQTGKVYEDSVAGVSFYRTK